MPNDYEELDSLKSEDERIQVLQGELGRSWEAYSAYATGLRTWFVAYGVGLLALFVTNAAGFDGVDPEVKRRSALLFAIGAFAQILVSMATSSTTMGGSGTGIITFHQSSALRNRDSW
jgi:peptidoglycan/LPS O-acetylase OafA/YrhL